MDDFKMQFHGFSPTHAVEKQIKEFLRLLQEEAPYAAHLRMSLSKVEDSFKGVIRISSQAGQFFAEATGTKLGDVCGSLKDRVHGQLLDWKAVRFAQDGITGAVKGGREILRRMKEVVHEGDKS